MQGDIDWLSAVEGNGREILIKERFEHDDLVAMFQERGKHRVLTWWGINTGRQTPGGGRHLR